MARPVSGVLSCLCGLLKAAVSVVRFFLMLTEARLVKFPVVSFLLVYVLSNGPFIDSHC